MLALIFPANYQDFLAKKTCGMQIIDVACPMSVKIFIILGEVVVLCLDLL